MFKRMFKNREDYSVKSVIHFCSEVFYSIFGVKCRTEFLFNGRYQLAPNQNITFLILEFVFSVYRKKIKSSSYITTDLESVCYFDRNNHQW